MAQCDYCGTRIFLGGVRDGDLRFCNDECHQNGILLALTKHVPADVLQKQVDEVHSGQCPHCGGRGPVDVHTSYRIWSALLLTRWSSRVHISCRSCGVKKQLGDALFCLLFGWWGFPWGLLITPVQFLRNLVGMFRSPNPSQPSPQLSRLVCLNIAAHVAKSAGREELQR